MKMYQFEMQKDFNAKYSIFFQQAVSWGWQNPDLYMKGFLLKEYEKMTIVEKMMYQDIEEMKQVEQEISLVEDTLGDVSQEPEAPFPLVGRFGEEYKAAYKYAMKYRTVKFEDTLFCPRALPEETFYDRLRKIGIDPDEEIAKCNFCLIDSQRAG
jgi:hypothetical protein